MRKPYTDKTEYVKKLFAEDTGGGCLVDLVFLEGGKVLGITDECVCLYESHEHFFETLNTGYDVPILWLDEEQAKAEYKPKPNTLHRTPRPRKKVKVFVTK